MSTVSGGQSLASRASRGAAGSLIGQGLRVSLQVLSLITLTRLLSPDAFGLMAMVLVVVGLGETVRDLGLSLASLNDTDITHAERSNLFWLNSLVGLALTAITMASSSFISGWYGDPRVTGLILAVSPCFLLNGLTAQFRADLQRRLLFFRLNALIVVPAAVGLISGVAMALAGAGYWSLAGQQIATAASSLLLAASYCRWLPSAYDRSVSVRRFVSLGGSLAASQVATYVSANMDSFVLGRLFGATTLGYYSRAYQLLMLPLNQLNAPATQIAYPILVRLRDDPNRYHRFLIAGQAMLLNVSMGALMLMFGAAIPGVTLLFGSDWLRTAELFQILALAGLWQAASYATYWILLSTGNSRLILLQTIAVRPAMVALVVVGALTGGATGVAWAWVGSAAYNYAVTLLILRRLPLAPLRGMLRNVGVCASTYLVGGLLVYAFCSLTPELLSSTLQLLCAVALMGTWILLALALFPPYRKNVRHIATAVALWRVPDTG